MVENEAARPTGRLYRMTGGDRDRPANWITLSTVKGRRIGMFLEVLCVEEFAERYPGVTFRATSWIGGRVDGRYLVRATWSRRVRWAEVLHK